jgi:hypothetical protein
MAPGAGYHHRVAPPAKPCPLPSGRLFSLSRPCLWQATLLPPRGEPRWWNKRRRNSSDGSGASLRRSRRRAPRRPPFTGLRPGAAGPARAGRTRSPLSWKRTTSRRTTCPPRSSPLGDNHSSIIHQSNLVTRGSRPGPHSRKRHLLCHRAPHIVRPHTGWWVQMQRACGVPHRAMRNLATTEGQRRGFCFLLIISWFCVLC